MKKYLSISSLLLISSSLYAYEGTLVQDANVRAQASLNSKVVKVVLKNQKVDIEKKIYGKNGTWYKLKDGYVSTELIDTSNTKIISKMKVKKSEETKIKSLDDNSIAIVVMDTNVNVKPKNRSSKVLVDKINIGYFRKSEKIRVLEIIQNKDGHWYKTPRGYVKTKYLKLIDTKTSKIVKKDKAISPKLINTEEKNSVDVKKINEEKQVQKEIVKKIEKAKKSPKIEDKTSKIKKEEVIEKDYKYFVGVSLGLNGLNVQKNDLTGQINLAESLDKNGISYLVNVGTVFKEKYIVAYNYERLSLDNINLQAHYVSFDYRFNHYLNPYLGANLGVSYLNWKIDPLNSSTVKDGQLSSLIYGVQAGIIHPLTNNLDLLGNVSYQKFDLKTTLRSLPAISEIVHKDKKFLGVALRYYFK